MDILSHTVTGIAAGTVVAAFSKRKFKSKLYIILAGTLAGAMPDLDALSLWSKFDSVIGQTFGFNHTGRQIYFGKLWYSHHGFMHSLSMAFLAPLVWWLIGGLTNRNKRPLKARLSTRWHDGKLGMVSFIIGYVMHLLEDMITPSGSWNGVRLLFPSTEYYGGLGKIWWWNNYDLFLIAASVVIINSLILLINRRKKELTVGVFSAAFVVFYIQVNTRGISFNNDSFTSVFTAKEEKSKAIQREILGPYLLYNMENLDNSINLNF
jgi:membrane-bound metal-dependent hydrolase YbcI (DUF457 family)